MCIITEEQELKEKPQQTQRFKRLACTFPSLYFSW